MYSSRYGQEAIEREAVRRHAKRQAGLFGFLFLVVAVFGMALIGEPGFTYGLLPTFVLGIFVVPVVAYQAVMQRWQRDRDAVARREVD
jgi:hypothetical protein